MHDTIGKRVLAAIEVVKFGFGDGVIQMFPWRHPVARGNLVPLVGLAILDSCIRESL
jgi:alanine racemase